MLVEPVALVAKQERRRAGERGRRQRLRLQVCDRVVTARVARAGRQGGGRSRADEVRREMAKGAGGVELDNA